MAIFLLSTVILPQSVFAGKGSFRKTGAATGVFDFCISVRFNATEGQLQRIREVFQVASDILVDSTDGQHSFGKISIINNSEASDQAEFWIHPQGLSGARANANTGGYGFRGRHVNLFYGTNFVQADTYGNGLIVVHEFAHLAYNVLDEYYSRRIKNPNGGEEIELAAHCPVLAERNNPTLNYCLMDDFTKGVRTYNATSGLYSVNEFCVASNHDKPEPNNIAEGYDTSQSLQHKNQSCWETMASLDKKWRLSLLDGLPQDAAPPPAPPVIFDTACSAQTQKIVLLLDHSGSMTIDKRLEFSKLAANRFIQFLNGGESLGIVSFSTTASVNFPLTQLNNSTSRDNAMAAVNSLVANGATNISDGLLTALSQLTSQGDCPGCEKTIILLSDGDNNVGLPPESVIAALQNAGVNVVAVTLGSNISTPGEISLKNIANQTEGRYIRAANLQTLMELFVNLSSGLGGYKGVSFAPQLISSGQIREIPVLVETGAASTNFGVIITDQMDNVTLSLRKPSGGIITENNGPNVVFSAEPNSRLFKVTAPEPGTWSITVSAGSIRTGNVDVFAYTQHDGTDLFVWIDDDKVYSTESVKVQATPTFEGRSIVGSSLTGTVVRPDASQVPITLFDDGSASSGDNAASDGVYTALFNNYNNDGTYTFKLKYDNFDGKFYAGERIPDEDGVVEDLPQPTVPRSTRIASATAIVSGVTTGDLVWVDDALPEGATPHGDGETWHWVDANPAPFMGGAAHQSRIASGFHQHYFDGATDELPINPGDKLFTYVFLDPDAMPKEILLQWNDGNWEHRAYWGENNINQGVDGTNSRRRIGDLPKPGGWVRLEVDASLVGLEGKTINGMAFGVDGGRATWDRAGKGPHQPVVTSPEVVWVNDALPVGATPEVVDDVWNWVSSNPTPFNGQLAHQTYFGGSGDPVQFRAHSFSGVNVPISIAPGDVLFAYVYLDPIYTPSEIILQWNDGDGWEHRAFWGNNFITLGTTGTESRRFMGGLPAPGQWVRLEVPASYVGLEGKSVSGMSFGLYRDGGRGLATWDYAGKTNTLSNDPLPLHATTPFYRFFGTDFDGYYYYSTNHIGRADQAVQRIEFYIFPNQAAGTIPLYRFRNTTTNRYFFGTSRNGPQPPAWAYEAIAGYVYPDNSTPGTVPLYIFRGAYDYFFTTTYSEGAGMIYDGISCFVPEAQSLTPLAPSRLQIIEDQSGYLLTWSDNSSNETGFKIEYRAISSWSQVATVGANISDFRIGASAPEGSYRVRATNAAGDSAYSNEAIFIEENPGPAPTNLFATATSGTSVLLIWTAPTGSISSYQVERSQSVNGSYTTLSPNPITTSFTDSMASPGTAYLYRVRAVYTAGGHSSYSNKDLATTIIFEDDPLNPNGTKTLIRAQHLIELRQAVSAVRILAGLNLATWTYPDPVSTPAALRRLIYLKDMTELRSELDAALTILNRTQSYPTNPPLALGSPVSAAHFTQIRDRVK
jgi:hypothetical protein